MKKYIAISACLLGERVRYDGQIINNEIAIALGKDFELLPFCPEVSIGMGVPRPPVQMVDTDKGVRVLGVDDPENDVTDLLVNYAENYNLDTVCGIVFKARSPSCGLNSTPIYNLKNEFIQNASGMFADIIRNSRPDIPMIEETDLEDKEKMVFFLRGIAEL